LHALLVANAVSITGTAMTLLAVPWFVLETTGSAGRTGIAAACETVPLVLASGLGGPLIDRVGARRAAVLSDLLSAVGVALVPLLHRTVGLAFWQLCLVVGFVGLVRAPGDTARAVLLPGLVELAGTPVERATSAYDGVSRGARMLGAPLAGALIAALGPADVMVVDAVTFVVSAALLRTAVPFARASEVSEDVPYLRQLREGLRALRADRLLLGIVVMVMVTNLLDAAWASVLLPVYAREVLGSSVGLGVLFGTFGLGALLGTVLYGGLGPRLPRWPVFTAAFLVVGGPRFGLLAAVPPYPLLLTGQLLCGLAAGCLNPVLTAVEYERIPKHLQSRVFGVSSAGVLAGVPAGALLGGLAVDHLGLRPALLAAGAAYLLATLSPLVWPVWRQMDSTRGSVAGDQGLQPDVDDVADLQGAQHVGVGRDAVRGLRDGGGRGDEVGAAGGPHGDLDGGRPRHAVEGEVAEQPPAVRQVLHLGAREDHVGVRVGPEGLHGVVPDG
jgi:MFS family permease